MATITIGAFSGTSRYMKLTVTEQSVDYVNNKSVVAWTAEVYGDSYYYDSHLKVEVNGSNVYEKYVGWDGGFPAQPGSTSGTVTVTHNSDGTKSIPFKITGYANVYSDLTNSGTLALTNIDRTAPKVTAAVSEISTNSLKIIAGSNSNCNLWQYSLDGGTTWNTFSTTDGRSAEINVTGLQVNTNYIVKVKARKTSNNVYGTSAEINVKTLGGAAYASNGDRHKQAVSYVSDGTGYKAALAYVYTLDGWKLTTY